MRFWKFYSDFLKITIENNTFLNLLFKNVFFILLQLSEDGVLNVDKFKEKLTQAHVEADKIEEVVNKCQDLSKSHFQSIEFSIFTIRNCFCTTFLSDFQRVTMFAELRPSWPSASTRKNTLSSLEVMITAFLPQLKFKLSKTFTIQCNYDINILLFQNSLYIEHESNLKNCPETIKYFFSNSKNGYFLLLFIC